MKAGILQTNLAWEDKITNLEHISMLLNRTEQGTDLVVLPEMFTTAFSMNPSVLSEAMDGPSVRWMKEKASEGGFALCGSLIIREGDKFYNRMVLVTPDADVVYYDKRHLHSMSGEDTVYSRGNRRVIYRYRDFNLNFQICYDLRFPVWSRNRGDSDVIIYSANWPEVRASVWRSLLVARAIENQVYVIGVNRTGSNPDGTSYNGDSVIIGPKGETIASLEPGKEGIATAVLNKDYLEKFRSEMPVWRDADEFNLL